MEESLIFPDVLFEPILDDIRPEYDQEYDERKIPSIDTVPASEVPVEYQTPSLESGDPLDRVEFEPFIKKEVPIDVFQEEGVSAFTIAPEPEIEDEISQSFYESIVSTNIAESESDITGGTLVQEREPLEFDARKAVIFAEILKPKFSNTDY